MSNLSRRAALTATAAFPLLPATALALQAEPTTTDEALLRLGENLDRAWARELALICDDGDCRDGYEAANDAATARVNQRGSAGLDRGRDREANIQP